jgi:hypothetical protein
VLRFPPNSALVRSLSLTLSKSSRSISVLILNPTGGATQIRTGIAQICSLAPKPFRHSAIVLCTEPWANPRFHERQPERSYSLGPRVAQESVQSTTKWWSRDGFEPPRPTKCWIALYRRTPSTTRPRLHLKQLQLKTCIFHLQLKCCTGASDRIRTCVNYSPLAWKASALPTELHSHHTTAMPIPLRPFQILNHKKNFLSSIFCTIFLFSRTKLLQNIFLQTLTSTVKPRCH